jgi:predicted RNA binding protein YcfA (HicA-like mRNA interferase family)
MSRLPVISGRALVRAFIKVDLTLDRQKGSHMMLYRSDPPTTVSVPDHRELDRGTLRALLRHAGVSPQELQELL